MTDWDELSPLEIDNQRLRADCAKLETAHRQNMREIDRLRAEIAAEREKANEYHQDFLVAVELRNKTMAERDALRNQITVERHKVSCLKEEIRAEWEARRMDEEQIVELLAERDALRALLREARDYGYHPTRYLDMAFCSRIDAALKGDDRDGRP